MSVFRIQPETFTAVQEALTASLLNNVAADLPRIGHHVVTATGAPLYDTPEAHAAAVADWIGQLDTLNTRAHAARYEGRHAEYTTPPNTYAPLNPHTAIDNPYGSPAALMKALQAIRYNCDEAPTTGDNGEDNAARLQEIGKLIGALAEAIVSTDPAYNAAPWGDPPKGYRRDQTRQPVAA